MASWLGYASLTWTASPNTVTPACVLNPFLPGGDAQTIYAAIKTSGPPSVKLHYKRKLFESDSIQYPGTFAVDFVSRHPAGKDVRTVNPRTTLFEAQEWERFERTGCIDAEDEAAHDERDRPILIALHGISGGSHELYVREVLDPLINGRRVVPGGVDAEDERGILAWDCLVVNARGCANSPVTTDRLFNARASWDVRQVVAWLHQAFPRRRLFAVGFSLGGNILTNYLGEEGSATPLSAAVICSSPWNLEAGNLNLQRTWMGREIYSKTLGANMKKLFEKHIEAIKKHPGVDVEKVRASRYLHEFDRHVQGPTWGYPTEGAYYRDASSTEPLLAVRIPTFIMHAGDDPIAPREVCPWEETKQNPFVVMCTTSMGGHLSWFEMGGSRWVVKPIVNFLRAAALEVDFDAMQSDVAKTANGSLEANPPRPTFDPIRRKLYFPKGNGDSSWPE